MVRATTITLVMMLVTHEGAALAYEEIEVKDGGTISGRVTFAGEVPEIQAIPVVKNPQFCGREVRDPVLVVNPTNKGLKNTVVYIKSLDQGKPIPAGTFIDAFKCLFVPHATGIFKGRPVAFHNNDTVFHNVHALNEEGSTLFNFPLPNLGQVVKKTIKTNGVIQIQCDSHVHMNGWAVSLDHPYVTVTDENGRFRMDAVPSGRYELVAWHEGYLMTNRSVYEASLKSGQGMRRPVYDAPHKLARSVQVKAGSEARVDFVLKGRHE